MIKDKNRLLVSIMVNGVAGITISGEANNIVVNAGSPINMIPYTTHMDINRGDVDDETLTLVSKMAVLSMLRSCVEKLEEELKEAGQLAEATDDTEGVLKS